MAYFILGGLGLLIGAMMYRFSGSFYGLVLGLMAAEVYSLRKRISRLEERTTVEIPKARETTTGTFTETVVPDHSVSRPVRESVRVARDDRDLPFDRPSALDTPPPPVSKPKAAADETPETGKNIFAELPGLMGEHVKRFFTTGNLVTKIGVIVLFFGFAFLLKYAAQRNMIPIEFRLIGVFMGGLALLGAGWRLRDREMMYGLLLQGGGVGVLYLTVYAAARYYHLLPYGFSFVVMFCLVIFSGILAVLQDAKYMALFGIIGGFLAPVLMSTGSGNHVVLFSYYGLLNLGILGIAWHKAWRELNLVGFIFTFVIASLWGGKYYQPLYFSTTEPFLILFFIYYVAIAVLYALRQPVNLKGYVDGTLVFGVPVVGFGLQYSLVHDFEYGLAISALSLGLFYMLLATILWRRLVEGLRMVTESFLAFGVVFGSLAIPLALDGRWTSAAWAIEGGAILWIGIRQKRLLPRIFGILLQSGAGIFFLTAVHLPFKQIPVVNGFFVGCILISMAGLFSSWYLSKRSDLLYKWEVNTIIPLLVWVLVWWFGAALIEIDRFISWEHQVMTALIHASVSFMLMDVISRRLAWKPLSYPSLILLPVMVMASLSHLVRMGDSHLFTRLGVIAWLIAFCVQYRLLFKCEKVWPEKIVSLWHQFTLWFLIFILTFESAYGVDLFLHGGRTWSYCVWGVVPGIAILTLLCRGERLAWPVRRFHQAYLGVGTMLPVLYLFCWTILVNFYHGDPAPLPFVPVVNPLEITQIYLLILTLHWLGRREEWLRGLDLSVPVLKMIVSGAAFLLLNAMVARTIHFWVHVPYTGEALYQSMLFQAAISILWGVTALVVTLAATKKGSRAAWIAGASILSLVVIKLFIVDLASTGTVARIVSFLGVGSLMLLIGYVSPLPPARPKEIP
jgi:uncharacterized membrane protein